MRIFLIIIGINLCVDVLQEFQVSVGILHYLQQRHRNYTFVWALDSSKYEKVCISVLSWVPLLGLLVYDCVTIFSDPSKVLHTYLEITLLFE